MRLFALGTLLLLLAVSAFAQCKVEGCGLVIRGKVADLEVERNSKENSVRLHVKLDVTFANDGNAPIILFKPEHENESRYWLGAWSLYLDASLKADPVFVDGYWQSISGSDYYKKLADGLDVKTPPAEFTKILKPNESWSFKDDFQIYFEAEKGSRYPPHRTWKEMSELGTSVFQMRISYELSPWNVGYFKPNLIKKLKKRWSSYGNLLVEDEKDRFNHFIHTSELMEIDISKAKERVTVGTPKTGQ
ncbi:MAG TPA: hypothetical protein VJV05_14085 [Pyrinomonadaceae bacterium]|nr:hypothetical protein [Pyrinomonadaceae bacterium]